MPQYFLRQSDSVCPSACDIPVPWSHRLEYRYLENNSTAKQLKVPARIHPQHPRSLILVPIESACATSYLSVIVYLSCTVSVQRLFCAYCLASASGRFSLTIPDLHDCIARKKAWFKSFLSTVYYSRFL